MNDPKSCLYRMNLTDFETPIQIAVCCDSFFIFLFFGVLFALPSFFLIGIQRGRGLNCFKKGIEGVFFFMSNVSTLSVKGSPSSIHWGCFVASPLFFCLSKGLFHFFVLHACFLLFLIVAVAALVLCSCWFVFCCYVRC